jgi:hypothetical protein
MVGTHVAAVQWIHRIAPLALGPIGAMDCRPGRAACCIAPSLSTPVPGMPGGKPAGVPWAQLTAERRCTLFADPRRPAVCARLVPSAEMCRTDAAEALAWLAELQRATQPAAPIASIASPRASHRWSRP